MACDMCEAVKPLVSFVQGQHQVYVKVWETEVGQPHRRRCQRAVSARLPGSPPLLSAVKQGLAHVLGRARGCVSGSAAGKAAGLPGEALGLTVVQ